MIQNPGGLWGISQEQLGQPGGKSAVNEFLYEICKLTRTSSGARIIEGEGGGIREVRSALRAAGMSQPRFSDTGVMFTALVPRHALLPTQDLEWLGTTVGPLGLSDVQRTILVSMRHGETWTNARVRDEFAPIDSRAAQSALQGLVAADFAMQDGERGQTAYRILPVYASTAAEPSAPRIVVHPAGQVAASSTPDSLPEGPTADNDTGHPRSADTKNGPVILLALADGPLTKSGIVSRTGLSPRQVTYALRILQDADRIAMDGRWGDRTTRYRKT